jgi:hypothetical protein
MHGSFLRLTTVFLAVLALPVAAQVYTWKDESGRVIMSDKPPPSKENPRKKTVKPNYDTEETAPDKAAAKPAPAPRDAKAGVDPELEKRKKEADAKAAAEKAAKDKAAGDELKTACEETKRNLAALESGQRMAQVDARGERYFIDDDQRARQIAEMKRRLAPCK